MYTNEDMLRDYAEQVAGLKLQIKVQQAAGDAIVAHLYEYTPTPRPEWMERACKVINGWNEVRDNHDRAMCGIFGNLVIHRGAPDWLWEKKCESDAG